MGHVSGECVGLYLKVRGGFKLKNPSLVERNVMHNVRAGGEYGSGGDIRGGCGRYTSGGWSGKASKNLRESRGEKIVGRALGAQGSG